MNAPLAVITNPANINAAAANSIQDNNVTTLALEVHKDCLTAGTETVIGGWTTASLRQARLLSGAPASGHQSQRKARRPLDPGLAPGPAAGQRGRDRPEGQGPLQRLQAQGRRRSSSTT